MDLGGLQGVLAFPRGIDPLTEGGAGLLIMLQLWQIQLQVLLSERGKEQGNDEKQRAVTSHGLVSQVAPCKESIQAARGIRQWEEVGADTKILYQNLHIFTCTLNL